MESRSRSTVLIAEDDDGIRSLLVAVAEREGFGCLAAVDGRGALQLLGDGSDPAVILLDLLMPRVDGFAVLGQLEKDSPHLLGRVIVLTALPDSRLRKCKQLDRVWCVRRKPLEIADLSDQIRRCAAASAATVH